MGGKLTAVPYHADALLASEWLAVIIYCLFFTFGSLLYLFGGDFCVLLMNVCGQVEVLWVFLAQKASIFEAELRILPYCCHLSVFFTLLDKDRCDWMFGIEGIGGQVHLWGLFIEKGLF